MANRDDSAAVTVEAVTAATPELVAGLNVLLPQLSSSALPLDMEVLAEIVGSGTSRLFVARRDGAVVGSLTLVVFRIPTGVRAWIEDVVVDDACRGAGIGGLLVERAVAQATAAGARTVDLTSRTSRQAAHRLYEKAGFRTRETSVYRRQIIPE